MRVELATRDAGPFRTFSLFWHPTSGNVELVACDDSGESCGCLVPRERALDAFYHPFVYLGALLEGLPAPAPVAP
jgi:hypothetical protein